MRIRDYFIAALALFVCTIALSAGGGGGASVLTLIASLSFAACGWDAWRRRRNPNLR